MKITPTLNHFLEAFAQSGRENFSHHALVLLFDFLTELDAETGQDTELDVIAICCEYSEDNLDTLIDLYGLGAGIETDEEKRAVVRNYLEDYATVVGETESGFVYRSLF